MADPLIVPAGEGGLITSNGMTSLELLIPGFIADGDSETDVPPMMLFLTACMIRSMQEDGFFHEQIEWMENQRQS